MLIKKSKSINKILVARVDRIGDFCHTLPALSLLKRSMPECQIDILISRHLFTLAKLFPFYDNILFYEDMTPAAISERNYQHAIILNDKKKIVDLIAASRIPLRFGQKRGWYQYKYTHRVGLNRSACTKPEWRYCIEHIEYYLAYIDRCPADIVQRDWDFSTNRYTRTKDSTDPLTIVVHPGQGFSEPTLSIIAFSDLIFSIKQHAKMPIRFLLSQGPKDNATATLLLNMVTNSGVECELIPVTNNFADYLHIINNADVFIAGSTGPLHLASLTNCITVGFYTQKKRNLKVRWSTLSDDNRRLAYAPPAGKKTGMSMDQIDIEMVAQDIVDKLEEIFI